MAAFADRLSGGRGWQIPIWVALSAASAGVVLVAARQGLVAVAAAGIAVPVVGWLFTTRHTGRGLALLLLYLGLADGYLKLRTGVAAATLVRDVLLYAIVLGVLLRATVRGTRLEAPPLVGWIVLIVAVVGVQLANPANDSVRVALAGLRPHLEFVPLFFLAYWTLRDTRALRVFLLILLSVGAINGVVTYAQSRLTPEQLATWGPGYKEEVFGQGSFKDASRVYYDSRDKSRVRPPGLGADAGFAGRLGILAIPAGLALLVLPSRLRRRALIAALLGLTVLGVANAQTRTGILASVLVVVGYAALASVSRRWWAMMLGVGGVVVVAATVGVLLTSGTGTGTFDRYRGDRALGPDQIAKSTQEERPLSVARDYLTKYPLGAGIGRSGPAAGFGGQTAQFNSETEFTYLETEVGIPGLIAFLSFQLFLVGLLVSRLRRVRDEHARTMLAAVGAPLIALLPLWFVTTTTANTPFSPFIWFAAGVFAFWLVRRPRLP